MLLGLRIENFALIDQLHLDLGAGLNVLTGETGAGKSIILDAIDIVLGGRVNQRLIRTGSSRASVEATFSADSQLSAWLEEQEIDLLDEASVVCSREIKINKTGVRSRSRLNGVLVNRQIMEQLRRRLVEITAQGQTVKLMIPGVQRELLDLYGGKTLLKQREKVAQSYLIWQEVRKVLDKRRKSDQARLQRLDLLQYQSQELEKANLDNPEELDQLHQERERLAHVVELQQLSYKAYQILYQNDHEENSCTDLLGNAENIISEMAEYDSSLEPVLEMIKNALMQVVEAGQQINTYGDSLEADPGRLEEVEARIRQLKQICRKYGPTLAEAITHYQEIQTELAQLNDNSQSLEELEANYQTTQEKYNHECAQLTKLRQQAGGKLAKTLIAELKPLAMDKVQFECSLTPTPGTINGADLVEFYFSPNPGEKLQPLSSTASGGEMSRFLLALKACFSQTSKNHETLIFDEIDVGVSGKVAQAIAEKLHHLSQQHQVLCVTHQPLVAAMADNHFHVAKEVIDQLSPVTTQGNGKVISTPRTVVRIYPLINQELRRQELAQLAGGESASQALTFAESLLTQAATLKGNQNS